VAAVVQACLPEGDGFRFLHTTPSVFTGNPFDPIERSGSERSDPTAASRDRDSAFEKSSNCVLPQIGRLDHQRCSLVQRRLREGLYLGNLLSIDFDGFFACSNVLLLADAIPAQ